MNSPVSLSIVAAVARNGVIGNQNNLPWSCRADMKYFAELTAKRPLVMGRKTFESLGGTPLSGRANLVVSGSAATGRIPALNHSTEGPHWFRSIDAAIREASRLVHPEDEIMIIGGGSIYRQTIDRAHKLYITEIGCDPQGDTSFPDIDPALWMESGRRELPTQPGEPTATVCEKIRR